MLLRDVLSSLQVLRRRQDQHAVHGLAVIGAKVLHVSSHQVSCLRVDGRLENRLVFIGKGYASRQNKAGQGVRKNGYGQQQLSQIGKLGRSSRREVVVCFENGLN